MQKAEKMQALREFAAEKGISTATGAALSHKLIGKDNHVFVFIGDREADEGQIWEAAQFAAHAARDWAHSSYPSAEQWEEAIVAAGSRTGSN